MEKYAQRPARGGYRSRSVLQEHVPRYDPAFAQDALALALAQEAISVGADSEFNASERSFLYTPFMHSESATIHEVAMEWYGKNRNQQQLGFEVKHRDIILKFGRYPHRNEILGRISTKEELESLNQSSSEF